MIIDQLPLMSGNPQDDDEFPIERGTTTYKTKLQALAAGIFGKIASSATPLMDGAASPGTDTSAARADHVHPTDTTRASAATLATYTRPNLLDNPYFVGGGSQLGYGTFPINQRGQTVYSDNDAYTIDRWKQRSDNISTSFKLTENGVVIPSATVANGIRGYFQTIAFPKKLLGKTVTLSALVTNVTGTCVIALTNAPGVWYGTELASATSNADGIVTLTVSIPAVLSYDYLNVFVGANGNLYSIDSSFTLQAVKLELGSNQTLARQEGSTCVLNEVPDFNEERIKCYAYFYRPGGNLNAYGFVTAGGTQYFICIPVPVPMAKTPVLVGTRTWLARGVNGYSVATPIATTMTNTSVAFASGSTVTIKETLSESVGDVNNSMFVYEIAGLQLSAE